MAEMSLVVPPKPLPPRPRPSPHPALHASTMSLTVVGASVLTAECVVMVTLTAATGQMSKSVAAVLTVSLSVLMGSALTSAGSVMDMSTVLMGLMRDNALSRRVPRMSTAVPRLGGVFPWIGIVMDTSTARTGSTNRTVARPHAARLSFSAK